MEKKTPLGPLLAVCATVFLVAASLAFAGSMTWTDSTELRLSAWKADLMRQFDEAVTKTSTDAQGPKADYAIRMMKALRPIAEARVAELKGEAGLAKCQEAVVKNQPKAG